MITQGMVGFILKRDGPVAAKEVIGIMGLHDAGGICPKCRLASFHIDTYVSRTSGVVISCCPFCALLMAGEDDGLVPASSIHSLGIIMQSGNKVN